MKASNSEIASGYLKAIAEQKPKDGEKEFEQLKNSLGKSEWDKGYLKALEGLLLTLKSNDGRYLYLQRTKLDEKTVKKIKEEFKKHSKSELHADYDRGYFAALTDYASILEQLKPWNNPAEIEETETSSEENLEASSSSD